MNPYRLVLFDPEGQQIIEYRVATDEDSAVGDIVNLDCFKEVADLVEEIRVQIDGQ